MHVASICKEVWTVQAVNTQAELEDTIQPSVLAVSEQEIQFLIVFFKQVSIVAVSWR
jgi:hypothetical protein